MLLTVDLHNHSPFVSSDYRDPAASPDSLVLAALSAGIDVLGLTDHFSVGYFPHLVQAAEKIAETCGRRVLVVPGCEMKVTWGADELHMIALLPPVDHEQRFESIVGELGLAGRLGDVRRLPHVKVECDPVTVARYVDAVGGLCHVAHADRWFGDYRLLGRPVFERLLSEAPLSAVEVLDLETAEVLPPGAERLRLIRSSDAHSPADMGRRTTQLELREASFEALREALRGAGDRGA